MKMNAAIITAVLSLIFTLTTLKQSYSQVISWHLKPIDMVLPVGKQRLVVMPEPAVFGGDYQGLLDIQYGNQSFYLTALTEFEQKQFVMKTASGKTIFVNVSATDSADASDDAIRVIYGANAELMNDSAFSAWGGESVSSISPTITLQQLMRFSMQHYYAPKRLIKQVKGIRQSKRFSNQKPYGLFPSGAVTSIPLASFSGGGYTITAVFLKNNLAVDYDLSMNELCGTWVAASYFPQSKLMASGTQYDSSMLFLVSQNDFVSQFNGTCGVGL
ncbi:DUF3438 family protein [Cysteiniphilum marinum]|uniref:DUF3438 family protein n=1 Tax=Cysteiniphilum marinum TaxID=2774191 RepID=UPI00193A6689|nr:DUF3438 family protein [Cysteiniphilum marinum]